MPSAPRAQPMRRRPRGDCRAAASALAARDLEEARAGCPGELHASCSGAHEPMLQHRTGDSHGRLARFVPIMPNPPPPERLDPIAPEDVVAQTTTARTLALPLRARLLSVHTEPLALAGLVAAAAWLRLPYLWSMPQFTDETQDSLRS